jgi:hypothetical protein
MALSIEGSLLQARMFQIQARRSRANIGAAEDDLHGNLMLWKFNA